MFMLGLNKTIDQLAMVVFIVWLCVEETGLSCLDKGIRS